MSAFAYDEYDAQVFELPRSKGRSLPLTRKSVTASSDNLSSPKKEEKESDKMRIPSKDDSAMGEFQSRSVSPRKVIHSATFFTLNLKGNIVIADVKRYQNTISRK